jgi:hypothetical protein
MASSGQRTGTANLPLHYGKVPPWLFGRMCQLARAARTAILILWTGRLMTAAFNFWLGRLRKPELEIERSSKSSDD